MLTLLKRDYKLVFAKKDERYFLLFFIPLMILLFGNGDDYSLFGPLIYSCTTIISTIPFTYKNRLNVGMFIQSLPISRNEIVITRYISLIVNFIFVTLYTWILVKIFGLFSVDYQVVNFKDIMGDTFFIVCIVPAVVFPILFSIKNLTLTNILVILPISFYGVWVLSIKNFICDSTLSYISILLCVLGILVISMMISLWIYNGKDLE